jgi:hypothetical protein
MQQQVLQPLLERISEKLRAVFFMDDEPKMSQLPSDTKQDISLLLTAATSVNTA